MAGTVIPFGISERRRRPRYYDRPKKSPNEIRKEKNIERRNRMVETLRKVSPMVEKDSHSRELEEIGRMGDEDLALEAVKLLEDEGCLGSVGRSCSKTNVRKAAADKLAGRIEEIEDPIALCVVAKFSDDPEARLKAVEKLEGKEKRHELKVNRKSKRGRSSWVETRKTLLRDFDFYRNVFMFGRFNDTKTAIADQLCETRLKELTTQRNVRVLEETVMHAKKNTERALDALFMVYAENPEWSTVTALVNVGANHKDSKIREKVVNFCKNDTSLLRKIAVFTRYDDTALEIVEKTEDKETLVSVAARGRAESARIVAITEMDKETLQKAKKEIELGGRENPELKEMDRIIYGIMKEVLKSVKLEVAQ